MKDPSFERYFRNIFYYFLVIYYYIESGRDFAWIEKKVLRYLIKYNTKKDELRDVGIALSFLMTLIVLMIIANPVAVILPLYIYSVYHLATR